MGNVLKYEIKKSRFMLLVIGIVIGCLEIAYLIGFGGIKLTDGESDFFAGIWGTAAVLLIIAACCSLFVGALYSVVLFDNEIRKKSGYMLFLTPTPTWQWILCKILMGLFATAALVLVFAVLGVLDIFLVIRELDINSFIGQVLIPLRDAFTENIGSLVLFLLNMILQIVVMITTIYLAIAMARTLLGNKKIGSFVAFLFWIGLEMLQSAISSVISIVSGGTFSLDLQITENGLVYGLDTAIPFLLLAMGINLVFAGACYGATVYLTDKKMSF